MQKVTEIRELYMLDLNFQDSTMIDMRYKYQDNTHKILS